MGKLLREITFGKKVSPFSCKEIKRFHSGNGTVTSVLSLREKKPVATCLMMMAVGVSGVDRLSPHFLLPFSPHSTTHTRLFQPGPQQFLHQYQLNQTHYMVSTLCLSFSPSWPELLQPNSAPVGFQIQTGLKYCAVGAAPRVGVAGHGLQVVSWATSKHSG